MRPRRTRSLLVSAFVLVLAGLGWFYLAPTNIGGSTTYVVTHGISMEPLIHQGDLVMVRPEDHYRVGQVVAYHSSLLDTVVLHRIIRVDHGHYFFKGDNNSFIDPTHPTRSLLIGSMWVHIAGGGAILTWLHRPWLVAVLFGAVAALLLLGGRRRRRRRRDRGRRHDSGSTWSRRVPLVTIADPQSIARVSDRHLSQALAAGALVFFALCVFAFVRPVDTTSAVTQPYTQTLRFGYHANVRPSPVYPSGTVNTGDPVYVTLVHALTVAAAYRLKTTVPYRLHGTIWMRGTLSNTSGWSRHFWLARPTRFVGASARTAARIDLTRFESLANRISAQIGGAAGGSYTLAVTPTVKIAGTVAGRPLSTSYAAALNLSVGASTLGGGSAIEQANSTGISAATNGSAQSGLVHSTPGTASVAHSSTDKLAGVPVEVVRWLALLATLLCGVGAWFADRRLRQKPPDLPDQIKSRYRHLIVPVEPVAANPDHPPIDVGSIDALAQLAERSERLILHDHREDVDNYLVDDQGTLFRFSARRVPTARMNGNGVSGTTAGSPKGGNQASSAKTDDHAGSPPTGKTGHAGKNGLGGDSGLSEPVANATAAILSSAAATLSAAAAEAAATATNAPAATADDADIAAEPHGGTPAGTPGFTQRDAATPPKGDAPAPAPAREAPRSTPARDAAQPEPKARRTAPASGSKPEADRAPAGGPVAAPMVAGRSTRSVSHLRVAGATDPRLPPTSTVAHWRLRPPYRLGLTIGPLALTFLAWRRMRARRRRRRGDDHHESAGGSWTTRNLTRM